MEWVDQINLQELKVAVAPSGGLIAVVRDEKKQPTPVQISLKPVIFLFTPSGKLKSSIKVRSLLLIKQPLMSFIHHKYCCAVDRWSPGKHRVDLH